MNDVAVMECPSPVSTLSPRPGGIGWRAWLLAIIGLALAIAAVHGRCVTHGRFLDDHAHYRQLRECGWSLGGLVDACRLELVGGVIDLWWLPQFTLRFFRPLAFGVMKLTYTLSDWQAWPMHIASLAWHLVVSSLLLLLLIKLGARPVIAWCSAALYGIHPGHVATVQWIAAQTELMVTAALLGSLLCFGNVRGWWHDSRGDGKPGWAWALGGLLLFVAALGCRENAIMLPLVVLCMEPLARRPRGRGTLALYVALVLISAGYLAVRGAYLGGAALPPRPYVVPPSDPDFLAYIFGKQCYYLLSEFLMLPCVPFGGLRYFAQHGLIFFGLTAVVVGGVAWICFRARLRRAAVLGPAILILLAAPVLPAFESPHHLYLPGIGWAIVLMLIVEALCGPPQAVMSRRRKGLVWFLFCGAVGTFASVAYFSGLSLDAAQQVEDQTAREIVNSPTPIRDGDTLYIANLPVISHYVKLIVEERTGARGLRVAALTWSPRLLGMVTPAERTAIDNRTLEMRIADDRYFAGPLGVMVREALGGRDPVAADKPARGADFRVEQLERDDEGVIALRFVFDRPLDRPGVHFFWGSPTRWACQVPPESLSP